VRFVFMRFLKKENLICHDLQVIDNPDIGLVGEMAAHYSFLALGRADHSFVGKMDEDSGIRRSPGHVGMSGGFCCCHVADDIFYGLDPHEKRQYDTVVQERNMNILALLDLPTRGKYWYDGQLKEEK